MKKIIPFATMLLTAASLIAADSSPKDDVINAAKKLAAADNYSWKSTPEGGGGRMQGPTDGKTEKGGFTTLALTMGDNTAQVVLKDGKGALKADGDWQSLAEASNDDGNGGFSPMRFLAMRMQTFKAPAEEAQSLATNTTNLKLTDGVYSGDLTDDAAKAGLAFGRPGGGNGPEVSGAKGSVKFWVTDGVLSKYQIHNEGHVEFNGNGRDINRTTTVEIKDTGKTKVEVSADAKKKLS